MARSKKERKTKRSHRSMPTILDDIEDQAAWSSSATHLPRVGNPWREAIWWSRAFRAARQRRRILVAIAVIMGLFAAAWIVYTLGEWVFST